MGMTNLGLLPFWALAAGAAIACQAAFNARLGVLLNNSLAATAYAFFASMLLSTLALFSLSSGLPSRQLIASVPYYYWFGPALLSTFGVGSFYFLIPRMGVAQVIAFGLTGQLILAMIASHFGWFALKAEPMNGAKLLGSLALIAGTFLIHRG